MDNYILWLKPEVTELKQFQKIVLIFALSVIVRALNPISRC